MLLKPKLKLPEKARRALSDRLGSLIENGESGNECEYGEELQTLRPSGFELNREIGDYDYDLKSEGEQEHMSAPPLDPEKAVTTTVSVSEIIAADEKRSDFAYELSQKEINLEKLQRIASKGLPDGGDMRATAWKLLLRYLPTSQNLWEKELNENRSKYKKLKQELLLNPSEFSRRNNETSIPNERRNVSIEDHPLSLGKSSLWHQYFQFTEILEQIDRDVKRTHPHIKFFSGDSVFSRKNREAMRNILLLFAKLNPAIGYVQGMNEILAPLYFVFSTDSDEQNAVNNAEADSFWCFVRLLSDSLDHFCEQLDHSAVGIHSTLSRLLELLKVNDEELWRHLQFTTKVNPQFYAFRWITLLLTQEFDFESILRIWDSLLSSPFGVQEMLLRVCCSMLLCVKSRLLSGDFVANLKLLQNYPKFDIEQLLHVAQTISSKDTSSFHMHL